jgi:hypothetical protein
MTKTWYTSKMLWVNAIAIIAIIAQGQFGFIVDPIAQVAILGVINIVLRAITGEGIVWSAPDA